MKKIKIINGRDSSDSSEYWLARPPEERIEAVEILREQYYLIPGFTEPPAMEKVFEMKRVR